MYKRHWLKHNETFIVCREPTNHVHTVASVVAFVGSEVVTSAASCRLVERGGSCALGTIRGTWGVAAGDQGRPFDRPFGFIEGAN
ncbi:hypothetical protein Y032_0723g1843 [Ancylostoma ceylanicum]|uniref:Uncharacterized protein n=1 Tax=Ancylostoma ceylanicum TaxID=53326 RepID=A0A016WFD5_9BILA|nr:hypothetical protein Y032_0723g1843 [Ancylostoma ceylanicum]